MGKGSARSSPHNDRTHAYRIGSGGDGGPGAAQVQPRCSPGAAQELQQPWPVALVPHSGLRFKVLCGRGLAPHPKPRIEGH